MPANNKRSRRDVLPGQAKVGQTPAPIEAPNIIIRKTLQDALIAGFDSVSQFARDFLDVDPYEKQAEFLDSTRDAVEANFVAGNRVGKTHSSGMILLWRAFYRYVSAYTRPDKITPHNVYKAVSTSLTIDQAKLAWTYALTFATNSKRFRPFLRDYIYSPFPTMYLDTRDERGNKVPSEIWARSLAKNGVYLLGHSINFILVDECAYIRNYPTIEDEVVRMRLADTGGSIFRVSTPNGRNFFYSYFQKGLPDSEGRHDPRYFSYRITTWDNPYVSRQFLEEQKARMMPEYYAQNVLGEFVSLSDFFKADSIQNLYTEVVNGKSSTIDYELPVDPVSGAQYVMGVDLGALRDPTIIFVWRIDEKPIQTVYLQEVRNSSWQAVRGQVAAVWRKYVPEYTAIDATGVGAPIYQQLTEEDGLTSTEGFVFSASSKPDILTRLQDAVQQKRFTFPYNATTRELINQLSFYRLDDKGIEQDYVMSLALVNWAYEKVMRRNQMESTLYDDLLVVPVYGGGQGAPGDLLLDADDEYSGGLRFTVDRKTGLFVPMAAGGENEWGF